jgi:hypothetical protein
MNSLTRQIRHRPCRMAVAATVPLKNLRQININRSPDGGCMIFRSLENSRGRALNLNRFWGNGRTSVRSSRSFENDGVEKVVSRSGDRRSGDTSMKARELNFAAAQDGPFRASRIAVIYFLLRAIPFKLLMADLRAGRTETR